MLLPISLLKLGTGNSSTLKIDRIFLIVKTIGQFQCPFGNCDNTSAPAVHEICGEAYNEGNDMCNSGEAFVTHFTEAQSLEAIHNPPTVRILQVIFCLFEDINRKPCV